MPPWAEGSRTLHARTTPAKLGVNLITLSCSMPTTRASEYHESSIVVTPFREHSPMLAATTEMGYAKNLTDARHCDDLNNTEPAGAYMFLLFILMFVACSLTSTMFPRRA